MTSLFILLDLQQLGNDITALFDLLCHMYLNLLFTFLASLVLKKIQLRKWVEYSVLVLAQLPFFMFTRYWLDNKFTFPFYTDYIDDFFVEIRFSILFILYLLLQRYYIARKKKHSATNNIT